MSASSFTHKQTQNTPPIVTNNRGGYHALQSLSLDSKFNALQQCLSHPSVTSTFNTTKKTNNLAKGHGRKVLTVDKVRDGRKTRFFYYVFRTAEHTIFQNSPHRTCILVLTHMIHGDIHPSIQSPIHVHASDAHIHTYINIHK